MSDGMCGQGTGKGDQRILDPRRDNAFVVKECIRIRTQDHLRSNQRVFEAVLWPSIILPQRHVP